MSKEMRAQVKAVITDYGGVLTSPIESALIAIAERVGGDFGDLNTFYGAIGAIAANEGRNPFHDLEMGLIDERSFLEKVFGSDVGMNPSSGVFEGLGSIFYEQLSANEPMREYYSSLPSRGVRTAIITNNVREWEPYWRSTLPADHGFDPVIDSSAVAMRKPDAAIFVHTLAEMKLEPAECIFVDDFESNFSECRKLGLHCVHYRDAKQAIAEIERLLSSSRS